MGVVYLFDTDIVKCLNVMSGFFSLELLNAFFSVIYSQEVNEFLKVLDVLVGKFNLTLKFSDFTQLA